LLDQLRKQLEMRHSGYENIYDKFKFLINIDNKSIDTDDIVQGANKLQQFYETDIDETTFTQDSRIHKFQNLYTKCNRKKNNNFKVYYCSAERSFSCLKRTKTYLRSTIGENRLNSLALLCIESELVSTIDFQDLIETFANLKSRTKIF